MPWPKGRPFAPETGRKISLANTGRKHTPEAIAKMSAAANLRFSKPEQREVISKALTGYKRPKGKHLSDAHKLAISQSLTGRAFSQEHKDNIAAVAVRSWRGGGAGDTLARALCPAGFVREHVVMWGSKRGEYFRLDFAHVDGKVNIELDGPGHKQHGVTDNLRDAFLRAHGWRVIRVRHD